MVHSPRYKWGSMWDSRCLVTAGTTQDEGVGRWGLGSCPRPLVIVENPGEQWNIHRSPCCGSPLLGCIPPASAYRLYGFWSPSLAVPLLPFGGVDGHWCGRCRHRWVVLMGADGCWHGMCQCWWALTWHASMGMVGVVGRWGRGVMWHCSVALVMASVGVGEIDEHTLAWPKCGCSPEARWRQWQPRVLVVVVVVVRGKMGRSQCVMSVMFQLQLLNLATHGRLLLIKNN